MEKYVLEGKDSFGFKIYYLGNWNDTTMFECAKIYNTLDEALEESRHLKKFGGNYKCVRLNSIRE